MMKYYSILFYYSIYSVAILLFYFLGKTSKNILLQKNYNENSFKQIFINLLIGITLFVVLFSTIKSNFRTINIGIVIIGLCILHEYYNKITVINVQLLKFINLIKEFPSGKTILTLLPVQVIFFVTNLFFKFNWNGQFPYTESHTDYVFQSALSESLVKTGFENPYTAEKFLEPLKYNFCSQYHYFELWLNGGISYLSGGNYELTYYLISYPVMALTTIIGIVAIWEIFNKVNILHIIFSFLIFHIGQIHFSFYNYFYYLNMEQYRLEHFGGTHPGAAELKLISYFPFTVAAILNIINRSYIYSVLIMLMLVFVYTSSMPVVCGIVLVLIIWQWYLNKSMPYLYKKIITKTILYSFLTIVLYFGFYYIFQGDGLTFRSISISSLKLLDSKTNMTRINIISLSIIQTFILYLPYIIVFSFYFFQNKIEKTNWLICILIIVSFLLCLTTWAVLCTISESVQLLGNNFPIINLLLATLFIMCNKKLSWSYFSLKFNRTIVSRVYLFTFLLITILLSFNFARCLHDKQEAKKHFISLHSDEYKSKIKELCLNAPINPIGVFVKHYSDYVSWADRLAPTRYLSSFLTYIPECYQTINISTQDIPLLGVTENEKEIEEKMLKCFLFYNYTEEKKKNHEFINYELTQLNFIKQYNIHYMLTSKHVTLNPLLKKLIKNVVCDSISGECFYLLDRNKLD